MGVSTNQLQIICPAPLWQPLHITLGYHIFRYPQSRVGEVTCSMNHAMQGVDITQAIRTRRTIKPEKMNGRIIPEDIIVDLLSQADWAPTHGRTEPWRFIVITPGRVKEFTTRHAGLYKQHTDPTSFTP